MDPAVTSVTDVSTGPPKDPEPEDRYVVVLVAKGGARLIPGERLEMNGFRTDAGLATVYLMTRFQEVGLPDRLPQELVFEVHCPGRDIDDAVSRAAALATSLAPIISFAVNAFVDVPIAHIAYEGSPGRSTRRFWQADVALGSGQTTPTRPLKTDLLFALLTDLPSNAEHQRLARAISQYHAALRHWTTAGQPLSLMHLYPALEALGPAVERAERARLGLGDEKAHAVHLGIDIDFEDKQEGWKRVLLSQIRRDVICQRDRPTYKAAYEARNGLLHGSKDMSLVRAAAPEIAPKLFDYIRQGILNLLNLDAGVRSELAALPPLDVTPLHWSITGILTGEVEDPNAMGFEGDPYPRMEWQITIDDLKTQPDGRLTVSPLHTFTARIASAVQFRPADMTLAAGLNDPANFNAPVSVEEEQG